MASLSTTEQPSQKESEQEMKQSMVNEAKAMNNMEGKDKKDDLRVWTYPTALAALLKMIPTEGDEVEKFQYSSLHLECDDVNHVCVGKTRNDIHRAFLLWSQKQDDRANDSFNVSKAFRRLEAFASYQLKMYEPYFSTAVDITSPRIIEASKLMNIKVPDQTYQDGAVCWLIDLEKTDFDAMAQLSTESNVCSLNDLMRYFWALMLRSMFDDVACSEGAIILEHIGSVGISKMMQFQRVFKPIETDMNAMFYGVMPFKMKSCIITGSPWWMSALLAFMRLFISSKMSARLKNCYQSDMHKLMGGVDQLPLGYIGGTKPYVERYPGLTMESGLGGTTEEEDDQEVATDEDVTF